MTAAIALKIEDQPSNLPKLTIAFSHVTASGELKTHKLHDLYRVVGIEHGNTKRARDLHAQGKTRHLFNEESIIKALSKTGTPFDIVEVVPKGIDPEYIANSRNPDSFSSFILISKS